MAGVSRSCLYVHKFHVPSDRQIRRLLLMGLVARHPQEIHVLPMECCGIRAALKHEQNMIVNKKLILSIMRELGIKGLPGPKKHKKNLVNQATEEDLVKRHFTVDRPNALWLTDITEHPTREARSTAAWSSTPSAAGLSAGPSTGAVSTTLVNDAFEHGGRVPINRCRVGHPFGPRQSIHIVGTK